MITDRNKGWCGVGRKNIPSKKQLSENQQRGKCSRLKRRREIKSYYDSCLRQTKEFGLGLSKNHTRFL